MNWAFIFLKKVFSISNILISEGVSIYIHGIKAWVFWYFIKVM